MIIQMNKILKSLTLRENARKIKKTLNHKMINKKSQFEMFYIFISV